MQVRRKLTALLQGKCSPKLLEERKNQKQLNENVADLVIVVPESSLGRN